MRSGLHRVGASYAGIQLAADAAEASARNLDLVTDSYSQGTMTIIQLLDAQNAAVLSQEAAANAIYTFLIDMLEVERALGRFYFPAPPEVIAALVARIDQVYVERGRTPPPR